MLEMGFFNQIGIFGRSVKLAGKVKTGKAYILKDICPSCCLQRYTVSASKTSGDEPNIMIPAAGPTKGHIQYLPSP
jgi:hypothetical protein